MKPDFKSTLSEGLSIIKKNILEIIVIVFLECFTYYIYSLITSSMFKGLTNISIPIGLVLFFIFSNLISVLIGIFFFSLITIIIVTKETQRLVPYYKQIQYVLSRLISMTITLFLFILIIFVGSLLLIIPGIIFGVKYSQINYFCLIGGENPIKSLNSSAKITKGKYLQLIGLYMVFIITTGILSLPLLLILFPFYTKFPILSYQVFLSFCGKILAIFYYIIWKTLKQNNPVGTQSAS